MNINHVDLAGYLTKSLDADEHRQAEEHLATCAECRAEAESLQEWTMALEAVPEAMLLDGPPDDADLLLQRTLRQIRQESSGANRRRSTLVGVAAAVVVAAAVAGGAAVGRFTSPSDAPPVAQPTAAVSSGPTAAPGTRTATAVDATTGARITVALTPAPGWIRVKAAVAGIPQGERCLLQVVDKSGKVTLAGSWLVSEAGADDGTTLDGSALVPLDQVGSVRVVTEGGKQYTSVSL
ncbi:anti-sigma factor family protein [Actinoplanes sp. RD1]|uniref:anti-sigma factor family protein n=1 Tax=Actinoplanes sp. RD1 TaxID=3064538 RepID=UPI002741B684|nr:zf-HC2 domain-containing protein [Actinoplanes sp. RD1]